MARLIGLVSLLLLSGCASNRLIWFRNEEASNRSIANHREPDMRVELGRGPGYERALPRTPEAARG